MVTENYDSLLESALGTHPFQAIWNSTMLQPGKLPIYHVHGRAVRWPASLKR